MANTVDWDQIMVRALDMGSEDPTQWENDPAVAIPPANLPAFFWQEHESGDPVYSMVPERFDAAVEEKAEIAASLRLRPGSLKSLIHEVVSIVPKPPFGNIAPDIEERIYVHLSGINVEQRQHEAAVPRDKVRAVVDRLVGYRPDIDEAEVEVCARTYLSLFPRNLANRPGLLLGDVQPRWDYTESLYWLITFATHVWWPLAAFTTAKSRAALPPGPRQ